MASGESKGSRRYDKENLLWQSSLTLLVPKAGPCMIKSWDYDPTPYWGAFARRALAGEKFEMKKMR